MFQAIVLFVLLCACQAAAPARAQTDVEVDLELVLAVDVSRSMTPRELEIQRRGYVEAITSKDVLAAIRGGLIGQIALTYVEWAGVGAQRVVIDWMLIRDPEDAAAFSDQLDAHFGLSMRRTSISAAINFARGRFDGNGFRGLRRVIDVSGDGANNSGIPVTLARDDAVADGIIINGLPLMTREGMNSRWYLPDLDAYYRNCVIGGPGAFVIPVLDWVDFPGAVRRKMILEIAGDPGRGQPPERLMRAAATQYDCLIGEKTAPGQ